MPADTGIMPEHMGLEEKSNQAPPADHQPSEKEKKTLKLVEKLFGRAKKARRPYDYRWADYYKIYRGKQWLNPRPSYRHSEVINLIFSAINSSIGILTDAKPKISFLPTEPSDREFSEILNQVLDYDWEKFKWSEQLLEVLYDANIYGTGLNELDFDEDALNGLGAIRFRSRDPFYCYPDGDATDVNVQSDSFIYAEPRPLDKVKREFPDKAKFLRADIQDFVASMKADLGDHGLIAALSDQNLGVETQNASQIQDKEDVLVITAYIKDKEEEEEKREVRNEDTREVETEFIQKLKFPKGRKVVIANGMVLRDEEMDFDSGKFPFSRLVNSTLSREFWGMSEIEQLESPQAIFNKLISFSLDVLVMTGNPIWVVSTDSGIDVENISNQAGEILEPEPGARVERIEGTQLQPYVLQLIDRMKLWFDDVSGITDVSRGVNPTGVTAASAIEALQSTGRTRVRLKARLLKNFLEDVGQQYASLAMQKYTIPRVFRISALDGSQKYFRFHVEDTEDGSKKGVLTDFEEGGTMQAPQEFLLRGEFDVRAETGSGLPFVKAEREQKILQLFDRQILDAEEVLDAIEYPNKEKVLERLQQRQEAAEAAAQAEAQGQAPAQ